MIPMTAKENSMGSHNWTTTKCPKITGRKTAQTSPGWNQGNQKVHSRTPTNRHNQGRQRTICSKLLLCKESRWETMTSSRLPSTKQIHEEELKHIPTNPTSDRPISGMHPVYKIQHKMGVQQHLNQRRQQMESSIPNAPRPLWTPCNVFWTHKLARHIPSNDEQDL